MRSLWPKNHRDDGAAPVRQPKAPLRLVIGLNQVDQIVPKGWDTRLNLPTEAAEREIERRCADIIKRLATSTHVDNKQIEYYSALKCYRLPELLNTVIQNSYAGFKFDQVKPAPFWEVEGVDPEAVSYIKERRAGQQDQGSAADRLLAQLGRVLSADDLGRRTRSRSARARACSDVAGRPS